MLKFYQFTNLILKGANVYDKQIEEHFPIIRDREEPEEIIRGNIHSNSTFNSWEDE